MRRQDRRRLLLVAGGLAITGGAGAQSSAEAPASPRAGFVVMHGKGGSPEFAVAELANWLAAQGHLVRNLEMPWSRRREYDVDTAEAEHELAAALEDLRGQGAARVFVAGHSMGGTFALYFGGRHAVDGVIAIAPGASTGSAVIREATASSVAEARQLVADGKGEQRARLVDYEAARGSFPVIVRPAVYLSWFEPGGAMDQLQAARHMDLRTPVLYVAPTDDYPGLQKLKRTVFEALPPNPLTRLAEPKSDHIGAPRAARELIAAWVAEVMQAATRP